MATTIKVDRLLLIKALEAEQKKQVEGYKRAMERFREAEKAYPAKLAKALEALAASVRKGGTIPAMTTAYGSNKPQVTVAVDSRPLKPNMNGCLLERQIRTLKLSNQQTVSISENSEYVQFACKL